MITDAADLKRFRNRRLHTTGQWRKEAKRYLRSLDAQAARRAERANAAEDTDTEHEDSFVPFEFEGAPRTEEQDSASEHESDYEPAKPKTEAIVQAAPVNKDTVIQSFGNRKDTKIVFNNVAQTDNVGASSSGKSSLNRSQFAVSENSHTTGLKSKQLGRYEVLGTSMKTEPAQEPSSPLYRPKQRGRYENFGEPAAALKIETPQQPSSPPNRHQNRGRYEIFGARPSAMKFDPASDPTPSASGGFDVRTPARNPLRAAAIDLRTPDVIDLCTPKPLSSGPKLKREYDLPTPTTLILRGLHGDVVVPAGTSLTSALGMVSARVGEKVLLLRDERGVIGEERWGEEGGRKWKVAVEWAW